MEHFRAAAELARLEAAAAADASTESDGAAARDQSAAASPAAPADLSSAARSMEAAISTAAAATAGLGEAVTGCPAVVGGHGISEVAGAAGDRG